MTHYVFVSDHTRYVYKFRADSLARVPAPVWKSPPINSSTNAVIVDDANLLVNGVYVGTDHGYIYRLGLDTGEVLGKFWQSTIEGTVQGLAYWDGWIYFIAREPGSSYDQHLCGFNVITNQKWHKPLVSPQGLWVSPMGMPVAKFGKVYCAGTDNRLYALHADGSPAWESPFNPTRGNSPCWPGPVLPDRIYAYTNRAIFALNSTDGAVIAQTDLNEFKGLLTHSDSPTYPPIALYEGKVIATDQQKEWVSGGNDAAGVPNVSFYSNDLVKIGSTPIETPLTPQWQWLVAPTVAGNQIFVTSFTQTGDNSGVWGSQWDTPILHALNAATGEKIWESEWRVLAFENFDADCPPSAAAVDSVRGGSDNVFVATRATHNQAYGGSEFQSRFVAINRHSGKLAWKAPLESWAAAGYLPPTIWKA